MMLGRVDAASAGRANDQRAGDAAMGPVAEPRGVVEVGIVGPNELLVFARRGPAQISYRGETETIAEGKSYRVRLNASEDATSGQQSAKKSGKRGKALVLIAVGAATAGGIAAIWAGKDRGGKGGVESPDRP